MITGMIRLDKVLYSSGEVMMLAILLHRRLRGEGGVRLVAALATVSALMLGIGALVLMGA